MTMPLKELVTQTDVRPASGVPSAAGDAGTTGNLPADATTFFQSLTRTHSSLDQNLKRDSNTHPTTRVPTIDTDQTGPEISQPSETDLPVPVPVGNRLPLSESDWQTSSALSDSTAQDAQTSDSSDDVPNTLVSDPETVPSISDESSLTPPHLSLQTGVLLAVPRPTENSIEDVSVKPPGGLVDALKANATADPVQAQTFASDAAAALEPLQPLEPLEPLEPLQPLQPLEPLEPLQPLEPLEPLQPLEPPIAHSDARTNSADLAQNVVDTNRDSNFSAHQQRPNVVLAGFPESLKTPLIQAATGLVAHGMHDELGSEPIEVPDPLIASNPTDEQPADTLGSELEAPLSADESPEKAKRLVGAMHKMPSAAVTQDALSVQVALASEFHQQAVGNPIAESAILTEQDGDGEPFETFTAFVADSNQNPEPLQTFVAEFRGLSDSNDVAARAETAEGTTPVASAPSQSPDDRAPETNVGEHRPSDNSLNPLAASNIAEIPIPSTENVSDNAPLDTTVANSHGNVVRHANRSDPPTRTTEPMSVLPSDRTATDQQPPRFDSADSSVGQPTSAKPVLGDERLVSDTSPPDEPRTVTKADALGAGRTGRTTDVSGPRSELYIKPNDLNVQQFVERAASTVRAAFRSDGQLRIRLHPPELGILQVEVTMQQGILTARLEVRSATAYRTLVDQVTPLHDALSQAGTPVQRVEIYLTENRSGTTDIYQEAGPQQGFQHHGSEQQSRTFFEQDSDGGESEPDSFTYSINMDQLDIQI